MVAHSSKTRFGPPVLDGTKAQTIRQPSDASVDRLLDVDGEHPKAENVQDFAKQHDQAPKCEVASANRLDCVWTDYCSQIDLFRAVQKIISGRNRGAEAHAAVASRRHVNTFAGASVVEPFAWRRVTQVSEPTEAETR